VASVRERLEEVLLRLRQHGGVEASAVVSRDGLLMASDIPPTVQGETFAAVAATMLGSSERAMGELHQGRPERVIAESKDGNIIAMGAGPMAVLVAMTGPTFALGLVLVEMNRAVGRVQDLL
jgi:predicted regulator of Ras-like GTPase activity (Roadblock/LC7/MglB family)